MYGASSLSFGSEAIHSLNNLVEAIKLCQIMRPQSRFAVNLAGDEMGVNLLSNGLIELDGQVPSIEMEKQFENAIQHGAVLEVLES